MLKSFMDEVGHLDFTYSLQSVYYDYDGYSIGVNIFVNILHAG